MSRPASARERTRVPLPHYKTTCPRGHLKTYVAPSGVLHCRICSNGRAIKAREKKRQARLRARRQRLARRPRPPKAERVWAAGHFEGEGTFTILSGGRVKPPRPCVSLSSTDRSVIDYFHARWPGMLRSLIPKTPTMRARRLYTWKLLSNDPVEGFILDMLAHLQTERVRTKAHLLLEHVRESAEYRRTPQVRARQFARMAKMRALNRRGVERPRGEAKGE